jgi:spermidine synthase
LTAKTARGARQLLTIESPLAQAHFMVRLLEPRGSCPEALWARLRDGSYDKPFVLDKGPRRLLQFDFDAIQSAMLLTSPQRLILAYTREMMAFLLFNPDPARILLLGLGGGSIAKFCYQRIPSADITAIEVSPDVIALRQEFSIPADDRRFRVIQADGADYVSGLSGPVDVVLADACDGTGIATQFNSIDFYRSAHDCLAQGGVFVSNLCGDARARADHLSKLRNAFVGEVMTLKMDSSRNLIAFAFRDRRPAVPKQSSGAADMLKRRFGINFPKYALHLS